MSQIWCYNVFEVRSFSFAGRMYLYTDSFQLMQNVSLCHDQFLSGSEATKLSMTRN